MKHWKYRPFVLLLVFVLFACTAIPAVMATSTKVTALTIRVDGPVTATLPFTITGKLTGGPTGVGVSDKLITVFRSTNGKSWIAVGTGWTDSGGYYTLSTTEPAGGKVFYRASFAGDKIFKAVTSPTWTVTVQKAPTHLKLKFTTGMELKLYGQLTDDNGVGINEKSVLLFESSDGGNTWNQRGDPCITSTDGWPPGSDGSCYFGELIYSQHIPFQAFFYGDTTYKPSESDVVISP